MALASGADKASLEIDLTGDDEEGAASGMARDSSCYETSSYDADQDMCKQSSEGNELDSNITEQDELAEISHQDFSHAKLSDSNHSAQNGVNKQLYELVDR